MIIGITGTIRSGKDTAANYLVSKGFTHYSLSDYIRKVVKEQGLDQTDRTILQKVANELRATNGPGYLAEKSTREFPIRKQLCSEFHPQSFRNQSIKKKQRIHFNLN